VFVNVRVRPEVIYIRTGLTRNREKLKRLSRFIKIKIIASLRSKVQANLSIPSSSKGGTAPPNAQPLGTGAQLSGGRHGIVLGLGQPKMNLDHIAFSTCEITGPLPVKRSCHSDRAHRA
jgi:hypothetical protein